MRASIRDGWLTVPYTGHDLATVHIAVGDRNTWQPAYLDWADGERVAKIRPPQTPGRTLSVWLRVGEAVTPAGRITT